MSSLTDIPVVGKLADAPFLTTLAAHPYITGALLAVLLSYLYLFPYQERRYGIYNVPGPPNPNFFWGNLKEVIHAPPNAKHEEWFDTYGHVIRYKFLMGGMRLSSVDMGFIGYVLQHNDDFIKPVRAQEMLERLLGNGVLVAEHTAHRRQRRVLNPAFSPAAIRDMTPIFYDKSYELQRKLIELIDEPSPTDQASPTPAKAEDVVKGARKIDVMRYMGATTLDVIGLAGFDYDFNALRDNKNELAQAFRDMFSAGMGISAMNVLQNFIPILQAIPTKARETTRRSRAVTVRIGKELMENKKKAVRALFAGEVEKGSDIGKDLLSLVIKANMASDLRADQQLTDDEVLAQITTFMLAGNETSSTALTWLLYRLALHKDVQDRLRAECQAVPNDRPSMDEVNALPFLDQCVHESLRFDNPVANTIREAVTDQVIPLSEPVMGRDGKMMSEVHVKKGTTIFLPIMNVNRSKEIWGEDADKFNPDRFGVGGIPRKHVPGVFGNLLTFLGGARNCM
jgi:cytochrome P450